MCVMAFRRAFKCSCLFGINYSTRCGCGKKNAKSCNTQLQRGAYDLTCNKHGRGIGISDIRTSCSYLACKRQVGQTFDFLSLGGSRAFRELCLSQFANNAVEAIDVHMQHDPRKQLH